MSAEVPVPPRRISDRVLQMTLHGYVVPWTADGPIVLEMPGSHKSYVPVFSGAAMLSSTMAAYGITYASVKQVNDGVLFIEDMEALGYTVIVNPYKHENGNIRYTEVLWSAGEQP